MYRRIFSNKYLSLKERIKRIITYYLTRRGATIQWKKRYKKVFEQNPDYKLRAESSVEKSHALYWKSFRNHINYSTIRVCKNISGISDPKYIPEEIFKTDIEPTLNNTPHVEFLTYKSFYNHWFPDIVFPRDYFHNVDGTWLDHHLNPVSFPDLEIIASNLDYPVVMKPNRDSYGGKNIFFPGDFDELMKLVEKRKNFLVQEKINQHSFFEQFNPHGLNTIRVNIYRSVKDNNLHVINVAMRMGVGGSLDNESAGGIVVLVRKNGHLNGFAVDKYGKKFAKHPDTKVNLDQKIPDFEGLNSKAIEIARKILYARVLCLDLCYDSEGRWRVIELNIFGATIRFAQYHGEPFFGEFTDEVFDYCLRNHWALK